MATPWSSRELSYDGALTAEEEAFLAQFLSDDVGSPSIMGQSTELSGPSSTVPNIATSGSSGLVAQPTDFSNTPSTSNVGPSGIVQQHAGLARTDIAPPNITGNAPSETKSQSTGLRVSNLATLSSDDVASSGIVGDAQTNCSDNAETTSSDTVGQPISAKDIPVSDPSVGQGVLMTRDQERLLPATEHDEHCSCNICYVSVQNEPERQWGAGLEAIERFFPEPGFGNLGSAAGNQLRASSSVANEPQHATGRDPVALHSVGRKQPHAKAPAADLQHHLQGSDQTEIVAHDGGTLSEGSALHGSLSHGEISGTGFSSYGPRRSFMDYQGRADQSKPRASGENSEGFLQYPQDAGMLGQHIAPDASSDLRFTEAYIASMEVSGATPSAPTPSQSAAYPAGAPGFTQNNPQYVGTQMPSLFESEGTRGLDQMPAQEPTWDSLREFSSSPSLYSSHLQEQRPTGQQNYQAAQGYSGHIMTIGQNQGTTHGQPSEPPFHLDPRIMLSRRRTTDVVMGHEQYLHRGPSKLRTATTMTRQNVEVGHRDEESNEATGFQSNALASTVVEEGYTNLYADWNAVVSAKKRGPRWDWAVDSSMPQTGPDHQLLVKQISQAICDLSNTRDFPPGSEQQGLKPPQAYVNFQKSKYSMEQIQMLAWEILEKCKTKHVTGELVPPYQRTRKPTVHRTFAELIEDVCMTLSTQKTICKRLLDAPFIDELIDNPEAQLKRAAQNKRLNFNKARHIKEGRRVLGEDDPHSGRKKSKGAREEEQEFDEENPASELVSEEDVGRLTSAVSARRQVSLEVRGGRFGERLQAQDESVLGQFAPASQTVAADLNNEVNQALYASIVDPDQANHPIDLGDNSGLQILNTQIVDPSLRNEVVYSHFTQHPQYAHLEPYVGATGQPAQGRRRGNEQLFFDPALLTEGSSLTPAAHAGQDSGSRSFGGLQGQGQFGEDEHLYINPALLTRSGNHASPVHPGQDRGYRNLGAGSFGSSGASPVTHPGTIAQSEYFGQPLEAYPEANTGGHIAEGPEVGSKDKRSVDETEDDSPQKGGKGLRRSKRRRF